MSHPLIASLGLACLISALPLTAQATDDVALPATNPLLSSATLSPGNFSKLRVKSGAPGSAAPMVPIIHGPDFVPKWQLHAIQPDTGASKLDGERFRFR